MTEIGYDWAAVLENGLEVPEDADLDDCYAILSTMLCAADPNVRDEIAYPILATWVARGELDGFLRRAGDEMAARLWHPEIQARTFAALILGWTIRRDAQNGELDDETVLRWRDAFAGWWPVETELRGWDERLGWLHAVAHGADTVRAFGRSPRLREEDLVGLLDLVVRRLLTPCDYLFAHAEDDRVAYALTTVLARPELTDVTGWLAPIAEAMDAGEPGPVPAFAANTIRALNSTYVALHRGVETSEPYGGDRMPIVPPRVAPAVLAAIADVLRRPTPWLG